MEQSLSTAREPVDEAAALHGYSDPQGNLENTIARAWKQVFNLPRVGRDENFFELGGNSLTGMQLTGLLTTSLSVHLPVVALFLNPTIRELAQMITDSENV